MIFKLGANLTIQERNFFGGLLRYIRSKTKNLLFNFALIFIVYNFNFLVFFNNSNDNLMKG